MELSIIFSFLRNIVLILIVLVAFIFLYRELKHFKYERRFSQFSLYANRDASKSYLDTIANFLWRRVKAFSTKLSKISFFRTYADYYQKFDNYENIKGIDVISVKVLSFLISFVFGIGMTLYFREFLFFWCFLLPFILFFVPDLFIMQRFQNRKNQLQKDLLELITKINVYLKDGNSMYMMSGQVLETLNGTTKKEWNKVVFDLSYGLSVPVVFERFYERNPLPVLKYIKDGIKIVDDKKGNYQSVFVNAESILYESKNTEDQYSNYQRILPILWVLVIIVPFGILLYHFIIVDFNVMEQLSRFFIELLGLGIYLFILQMIVRCFHED